MDPAGVVLAGREQGQAVVVVMLVVPGKNASRYALACSNDLKVCPKIEPACRME
jgi:hypothetical protein